MGKTTKLAAHIVNASKVAKIAKATRFGIITSAILTFLIFAISYYGTQVGNFTFSVDGFARQAGIAMYEYADDIEYKTRIISDTVEDNHGMTGLCGTEYYDGTLGQNVCIPEDSELISVDGPNNGSAYIAHTFYVVNAGELAIDMSGAINILSAYKNAEEALRVRVYINDVGTTYAKVQSNKSPTPGELEPYTEEFYSNNKVYYEEFFKLNPGDTIKVTIVVWYEGVDYDHDNDLFGGGVKLDMKFSVIKVYEEF